MSINHRGVRPSDLAKNTTLNVIGQVLPLLITLLSVPVVIRKLGVSEYGILSMTSVILGTSVLFDFGLARAVVKFAAGAFERKDFAKVGSIVGCTVWMQLVVGGVAAVVVWLTAPFLVSRVFTIPAGHIDDAKFAITATGIGMPMVLACGSYRGMLEAAQRFDLTNILRVICSTIIYMSPLVGVWSGFGLSGITILMVLARIVQFGLHWLACVMLLPGSIGLPRFNHVQLRELLHFSGWIALTNILSPLQYHIDRMMLAGLLPVATVSYFSVPYEMVTGLCLLPSSLAASMFPIVSILSTSGSDELKRTFLHSLELVWMLMALVAYVMICGGGLFFSLWISPKFAGFAAPVAQVLAIGLLFTSINLLSVVLFQGISRPDVVTKQQLARFPITCLLSWGLIFQFGLIGAAISWTIAQILTTLMYCWSMRRLLTWNHRELISRRTGRSLMLLGGLVAGTQLGSSLLGGSDVRWRVFWTLAGLVVQVSVTWKWLLVDDEREWVMARVRRICSA